MLLTDIKNLTNSRLAGEQLSYSTLLPYFDAVVDEINSKMHSCFKTFSEVNKTGIGNPASYEEFPDRYIRTVVCIGAAYKWYIDDEEGIETAAALGMQYENNLFIMLRDYGPLIPEEKQQHNASGFFQDPYEKEAAKLNPDIRYIEVKGLPGASVTDMEIRWEGGVQHLWAKIVDYSFGYTWVDCGVIDTKAYLVSVNQALPAASTKYTIGFEVEDV